MRLADMAVAEYEHIESSIPFGGEWEISLTGEERQWSDQTNSRYDTRTIANAKTTLQIPSVEPDICEIIENIESMFALDSTGELSTMDPTQQEEFVRGLVRLDMLLPILQEIRFHGSAEWTSENTFWRSSDGSFWIKCATCPLIEKRIGFTESVEIDVNGFSLPTMPTVHPSDEVVGRCFYNKTTQRKALYVPSGAEQSNFSKAMLAKVDSDKGRKIYPQRMAIVEPVFANIYAHKRMDRFTVRGKIKVTIQWLLYCMVHNREKVVNYGFT